MMNHYFPYLYIIRAWSDVTNGELNTEHGLVYAENYSEAVKQITQYYGEDMIEDIQFVTMLEDYPIVLSEEVVKAILNDDYNAPRS